MTTYFEHVAGPKEVKLDVVEYDEPLSEGIEVSEKHFESTGEYLAYIARETGRGPG